MIRFARQEQVRTVKQPQMELIPIHACLLYTSLGSEEIK